LGQAECLAFLFDACPSRRDNQIKGDLMTLRIHRKWTVMLILILLIQACNLPSNAPEKLPEAPQPGSVTGTATETVPTPVASTSTSEPAQTATSEASPTSSVVSITANGGNLNVRRGPGVGYNPVSALFKGETSNATARDSTGEWLLIAIPKLAGKPGWVNAKTKYSLVKGEVLSLPVQTVDPPKPAYVLNCTLHQMDIYPAGISVPPKNEKPNNKVEIGPGEYEVFDSTISGGGSIDSFTVLEGDTIRIKKDGLGVSYACP
jgi:hypothetical protein